MKNIKLATIALIVLIGIIVFMIPSEFIGYAFSQNEELLTNGGFEDADTSMWGDYGSTIVRDSSTKNSGSYAMKVTNRQQYYSSPVQNITAILRECGQGSYNLSAYMKLLAGIASTQMYVVISIESSGIPVHWVTGNAATITNSAFTQSIATDTNIMWEGTLTRALMYVQNVNSAVKSDLYVDDYSLVKTSPITSPPPIPGYIATAQTLAKRDSGAPKVGAIRWDAWLPRTFPTFGWNSENNVGAQVARSLGPNKYHFRLPYFSISNGDNAVDFPVYSQEIMDNEINYAEYAGIDYWAYCWYPIGSGMDTARDRHVSSSIRDKVKMCAILNVNPFGNAERTQLVSYMKESFYMTVQGGRPLLFFFYDPDAFQKIIFVQQECIAQGLQMPYCVSMGSMGDGFDAVSNYAIIGANGQSFASLAQNAENTWNSQKYLGDKVLPLITCGWDPRPRYDHPVTWTSVDANSWAQTATANEIVTHTNNAINWTNTNTNATFANAVLMYAWNEHDEGGWLCPTTKVDGIGNVLKDAQGKNLINTDRIDALHNLLNPDPVYVLGDVNNSGSITSTDALMALQIAVGKITPDEATALAADVNKSGTVTASDALKILQYASGKITSF